MTQASRTKKLINAPEDVVGQMIAGMVAAHPACCAWPGRPAAPWSPLTGRATARSES
jgi:hypothetical protein